MPVILGVPLRVNYGLVHGVGVLGVEQHEDLGVGTVAVENQLSGVASDIDQPMELVQKNETGVHVDSSVF
mgnify:CR=1 FL=1